MNNAVTSKADALPVASRWEQAYQRFETPEQEIRKFNSRLRRVNADKWDRRLRILEICSGRGNGLRAWHALGFSDVLGVDLSLPLVATHTGPGVCILGDVRSLPLASASRDVVVVQGGLHHLFTFEDVAQALAEMTRVLVPDGRVIIIEPWRTPFLRCVHALSRQPAVRRLSNKMDAFETMLEEERNTYEQWLGSPERCLEIILKHVNPQILERRWGKLTVVGTPRRAAAMSDRGTK